MQLTADDETQKQESWRKFKLLNEFGNQSI